MLNKLIYLQIVIMAVLDIVSFLERTIALFAQIECNMNATYTQINGDEKRGKCVKNIAFDL